MRRAAISRQTVEATVLKMCSVLEQSQDREAVVVEHELRHELVACILSSRVRSDSANAALMRLHATGLMDEKRWLGTDHKFEGDVANVLGARCDEEGQKQAAYRFPKMRAVQLAGLRGELQRRGLAQRVFEDHCPRNTRARLVRELPGIGPKQASMFLRNIGFTYELAILDVHLINYFILMRRLPRDGFNLSNLDCYEAAELKAIRYATTLGYSVGYLDWAVWITMRALSELEP